jgi:hypothetical protein
MGNSGREMEKDRDELFGGPLETSEPDDDEEEDEEEEGDVS